MEPVEPKQEPKYSKNQNTLYFCLMMSGVVSPTEKEEIKASILQGGWHTDKVQKAIEMGYITEEEKKTIQV